MLSTELKQLLSLTAIALTFIAYIPYYRDILSKKTTPHLYSWTLWGLLTVLIVAQQLEGGAGLASLVTVAAGTLCVGVALLALKSGKRYITTSDKIVAGLGLTAIFFWLIVDQPVLSVILVILADVLAFIPTIRKSWKKPYSETLSLYITNAVRYILAFLAISEYTFLSAAWIVSWIIVNTAFSMMLISRRRKAKSVSRKRP